MNASRRSDRSYQGAIKGNAERAYPQAQAASTNVAPSHERRVMTRISISALAANDTSLTRYLDDIKHHPMLEPQQEFMLATRWREHGDQKAAHELVVSHLKLVVKIAVGYRGYGLPISEIVSEGNIGLMQAVKRFDPQKGFRLTTYAIWWIKAAIQEYILRSWSLVRMGTTSGQRRLFFNLRKAKSRISALDEGDLQPDQVKAIAKQLAVGEQNVIDMNRRLNGDVSLNVAVRDADGADEWIDWLVDQSEGQESHLAESQESENRHKVLSRALSTLKDRERWVFTKRRLADEPATLAEVADALGISRERVRQIEARAFEKVKNAVQASVQRMEQPGLSCSAVPAN
jgi:RNA polymerase sigma-32 factor